MARRKKRRARRRNPFVRVKGKRYRRRRTRKAYSYRRAGKRISVRKKALKKYRKPYSRYYYGKSPLGDESEIPRKYRKRAAARWARWATEHPQEAIKYTRGLEQGWAARLKKAGYSVARKNALPLMDNPRRRRKRRKGRGRRKAAYRTRRRRRVSRNPSRKRSRRRRRRVKVRGSAVYYRRRRRGRRRMRRLYTVHRNPRKGRKTRKGRRRGRRRRRHGSAYRATSIYYRRRRGRGRNRTHRLYRRLRNPGHAIAPVPIINPFLGGLSFNPLVDEVLIPAAAGAAGFYAARLLGNLVREPIGKITGPDWAPVATNAAVLGAAWYLRDRIPFRFRTPILIGVGLAFLDSLLTKFGVSILTARDGAEKAGETKAAGGLDMDLAEISSVGREYDDSDLYGHGAYVQEPTAGMGAYVQEPTAGTGAYISSPTAGMGQAQISEAAAGLSEIDNMIDEAEQTSGIGAEVSEAAAGFGTDVNEAAAGWG